MEQLGSHWTDFHEISYLSIFWESVEKLQISFKSDRNRGTLHSWAYLSQFFLEWELFQTEVAENMKIHILCSMTFFRKSYRLWDNVEKYRSQMSIWRMRIACWIPTVKNAHSGYLIVNSSLLQQWLQERTSLLSYMYIARFLKKHVLQVRCKEV